MSRDQLAASLGVSAPLLRRELKNLGVEIPSKKNKRPLHVRLLETFTEEELSTTSQYKIAEHMQTKQPAVAKALKMLGIERNHTHRAEKRNNLCQQVVDHIKENGGWIAPTIRELGLNICRTTVYEYCKDNSIDLAPYHFAHRQYGHWLTLPGIPERCYVADYRLKAECTRCGSVHTVQLVNLKTGASTQCRDCAASDRRDGERSFPVICIDTQERFKSVRALARHLNTGYAYLLIALKRTGNFNHGGLSYQFCSEDSPDA